MIDVVGAFGVSVLPDELKTPEVLHVLFSQKDKIHAQQEFKARRQQAPLDSNKIYELVLKLTGNYDQADEAKSRFQLDESRKERQLK